MHEASKYFKHAEVLCKCRFHNPKYASLRLGLKMFLLVPSCLCMEETPVRPEELVVDGFQILPMARGRWVSVRGA